MNLYFLIASFKTLAIKYLLLNHYEFHKKMDPCVQVDFGLYIQTSLLCTDQIPTLIHNVEHTGQHKGLLLSKFVTRWHMHVV